MKIVWDEPKRLANIEKHGLDFAVLDEEFFLASTIRAAKAGRFMAIGRVVGGVVKHLGCFNAAGQPGGKEIVRWQNLS